MTICTCYPGLYITVGQPCGWLRKVLNAAAVMPAQKVIDIKAGRTSEISPPFFVPRTPLNSETNQRSNTIIRHLTNRGSLLSDGPWNGFGWRVVRPTSNRKFCWNFGISEISMLFRCCRSRYAGPAGCCPGGRVVSSGQTDNCKLHDEGLVNHD